MDAREPGCEPVKTTARIIPTATSLLDQGAFLECLDRAPDVAATGASSCVAIVAHTSSVSYACSEAEGLHPVSANHAATLAELFPAQEAASAGLSTFCEVHQLTPEDGEDFVACQQDPDAPLDANGNPVSGFCFIDHQQPISNPELLKRCLSGTRGGLRFVGRPGMARGGHEIIGMICESSACAAPVE